jgi:hypothetical protein
VSRKLTFLDVRLYVYAGCYEVGDAKASNIVSGRTFAAVLRDIGGRDKKRAIH